MERSVNGNRCGISAGFATGLSATCTGIASGTLTAVAVANAVAVSRCAGGLVLLGVFIVITIELLGIRSLAFAVGAYLSIGTTLAIFTGGVVRWMVDAAVKKAGNSADAEGDVSPGSLYASGLIAAGGIIGLLGVALKLYETTWGKEDPIAIPHSFLYHDWVSVIAFAALAFSLYYFARKPLGEQKQG